MQVFVDVTPEADGELTLTPDEIAQAVLDAIGGDPARDHVHVQVAQIATGQAGVPSP